MTEKNAKTTEVSVGFILSTPETNMSNNIRLYQCGFSSGKSITEHYVRLSKRLVRSKYPNLRRTKHCTETHTPKQMTQLKNGSSYIQKNMEIGF